MPLLGSTLRSEAGCGGYTQSEIPVLASANEYRYASVLIAIVFGEVIVLLANGRRCPLTAVAARFTNDRRDNFDIYLPEWLARHNKLLFGALYVLSVVYTVTRWTQWE